MSESYNDFATIYDSLTDDVEYEERVKYIESLIDMHLGKNPDIVCDLGCGTGTVCTMLSQKGYDCIGIDSSESMLSVATDKNPDGKILYLNQDITEFELFGTVDVFLSMLDTVNYITETDGIENLFRLAHNYLNPDGIFIFDINSLYKFENILGNNTIVYETGDVFYTWENYYENEELEFYLNFFVAQNDGSYKRFTEEHFQRYYSIEYLSEIASKYDFTVCGIYGDMTLEKPLDKEERIFIVLKK